MFIYVMKVVRKKHTVLNQILFLGLDLGLLTLSPNFVFVGAHGSSSSTKLKSIFHLFGSSYTVKVHGIPKLWLE